MAFRLFRHRERKQYACSADDSVPVFGWLVLLFRVDSASGSSAEMILPRSPSLRGLLRHFFSLASQHVFVQCVSAVPVVVWHAPSEERQTMGSLLTLALQPSDTHTINSLRRDLFHGGSITRLTLQLVENSSFFDSVPKAESLLQLAGRAQGRSVPLRTHTMQGSDVAARLTCRLHVSAAYISNGEAPRVAAAK